MDELSSVNESSYFVAQKCQQNRSHILTSTNNKQNLP